MVFNLYSKPFESSKVDVLILKDNYLKIGNGVISFSLVKPMLENNNWENFEANFIPIRNKDELYIFEEKLQQKINYESAKIGAEDNIRKVIDRIIKDPQKQEEAFQIVINSSNLIGEELQTQMDKMYKISPIQKDIIEIFAANPLIKVNKNSYVINERKKAGKI